MDIARYGFLDIPENSWTNIEIQRAHELLQRLKISLEIVSGVAWIENIADFPKEVRDSKIVSRFIMRVNQLLPGLDLESRSFEDLINEIKDNYDFGLGPI